jgi:DNA polymerase
MSDELAEMVGDVRAWLDHALLRGVSAEHRQPVEVSPTISTAPPAWTSLAVEARRAADDEIGVGGLERIRADLGDCRRCGLCKSRSNIVFGVGAPDADLVVVGEGPGYHEDRTGEPFVGPAGEMLDKMLLHVVGLPRSAVYIANVVKCRPPGNRNPQPEEVAACRPFLERQIAAIQPRVILVLGAVAFKTLFDTNSGIKRSRGLWRDFHGVPTLPTLHPAYLLRQPQDKRLAFNDLKALKARYDELGGRR